MLVSRQWFWVLTITYVPHSMHYILFKTHITMAEETLEKLRQEIRRGVIVLAVLGALREEHYGYSLGKTLKSMDINIDEGTLYPLVRRLEKQGLLVSEWREESKRKKRFYRLSDNGESVFRQLREEWLALNGSVMNVIEEKE